MLQRFRKKARVMLQNCPQRPSSDGAAPSWTEFLCGSRCKPQIFRSQCAVDSNRTGCPKKANFKLLCVPALPPQDSLLPIRSCCSENHLHVSPQTSSARGCTDHTTSHRSDSLPPASWLPPCWLPRPPSATQAAACDRPGLPMS